MIDIVVEVRAGHKDAMQVWAFTLFPLLKRATKQINFLLLTKKKQKEQLALLKRAKKSANYKKERSLFFVEFPFGISSFFYKFVFYTFIFYMFIFYNYIFYTFIFYTLFFVIHSFFICSFFIQFIFYTVNFL